MVCEERRNIAGIAKEYITLEHIVTHRGIPFVCALNCLRRLTTPSLIAQGYPSRQHLVVFEPIFDCKSLIHRIDLVNTHNSAATTSSEIAFSGANMVGLQNPERK